MPPPPSESPARAREGALLARCLAGSAAGHLGVGVLLVLLLGIPDRGPPERAVRVRLVHQDEEAAGPKAMPAEARRPSRAQRLHRSRPREAGAGGRPGTLAPARSPDQGGVPEEGPSRQEPESKELPGHPAQAPSSNRGEQAPPPAPLASRALEGFESSSGPGPGPGGGGSPDQFGKGRPVGGGGYGPLPAEGPTSTGRGISGIGGGGGSGGGTTEGIGAGGGAGPGGARGGASPADLRKLILARIDRAKRYPVEARRRGIEGSAVIRFRIAPDGSVAAVEVVRPSGSPVLDEASRDTILRASPFPVVDGWIQVQLAYGLTD